MPTSNLCQELLKQYQSSQAKLQGSSINSSHQQQQLKARQQQITSNLDDEYLVAKKRRVIKFVRSWMLINREHFFQQQQIQAFVMVSRAVASTGELKSVSVVRPKETAADFSAVQSSRTGAVTITFVPAAPVSQRRFSGRPAGWI